MSQTDFFQVDALTIRVPRDFPAMTADDGGLIALWEWGAGPTPWLWMQKA